MSNHYSLLNYNLILMILSSFSYKTSGWELNDMNDLQLTNLLVGKNASGKTRTIRALQNVTNFLQMKPIVFGDTDFKTKLVFSDPQHTSRAMVYSFQITKGKVVTESLIVSGKQLIKRDTAKTVFMGTVINPPAEKLVVQVRRDQAAYPEVEALMEWAEGVIFISCSNINPFTVILGNASTIVNPLPFSTLVDSLNYAEKKQVIAVAKRLGYEVVDISTVKANSEMKFVSVNERYVKSNVMDFQLSSGMMRVLYILCFLEYVKHTDKNSLLLIDDLGEGLDYNRATLLGRKVFESCEHNHLQMVASSNDSFMMDVVDISKWQILRRKNSKLTVINPTNTPKLFEAFRMTGLSNFDFFSSDFIETFIDRNAK